MRFSLKSDVLGHLARYLHTRAGAVESGPGDYFCGLYVRGFTRSGLSFK